MKDFFVNIDPENPFETIGRPSEFVSKKEFVRQQLERARRLQLRIQASFPDLLSAKTSLALSRCAEETMPYLPARLETRHFYETEVEAEHEVEMQKEKEQELERRVEEARDTCRHQILWPHQKLVSAAAYDSRLTDSWKMFNDLAVSEATYVPLRREDMPLPYVGFDESIAPRGLYNPFSPDLFASLNLMPIHPKDSKVSDFIPFGYHQDMAKEMLVVKHRKSGKLQAILLTQDEAVDIESHLRSLIKPADGDIALCLYHVGLGQIYAQGPDPIDELELHESDAFKALRVQAKFFNGEFLYTPQEIEDLRRWIFPGEALKFYRLFTETIRPIANLKAFAKTPLGRLFAEMGHTGT